MKIRNIHRKRKSNGFAQLENKPTGALESVGEQEPADKIPPTEFKEIPVEHTQHTPEQPQPNPQELVNKIVAKLIQKHYAIIYKQLVDLEKQLTIESEKQIDK